MLAQPPHGDTQRHGERSHAHQHHVGVVSHVLLDERVVAAAPEYALQVVVRLGDHALGAAHGVVGLAANLQQPVLVDLRRDRDGVVGVQHELAPVIGWQVLVDQVLVRHLHYLLGVREKRAVGADGAGQIHSRVLGHAPRHERGVHRLLPGVDPAQHPAQVAHGERVVVLAPERARVVQRAVAHHCHQRQPQAAGHGERLEGVEPADAARSRKHPGAHRGGVLDYLELRVLALGDYVLALQLAVGDEARHELHHRVVGANGVGGYHVHVGQGARYRDRLRTANQLLALERGLCLSRHHSLPSPRSASRSRSTRTGRGSAPRRPSRLWRRQSFPPATSCSRPCRSSSGRAGWCCR